MVRKKVKNSNKAGFISLNDITIYYIIVLLTWTGSWTKTRSKNVLSFYLLNCTRGSYQEMS